MVFIVYFNGENVDKKFSKEFINHVCGGRIVDHVDWTASTRKKLIVLSYHVVNKLLNLNQKVVWPDGTPFKCHHYRQHSDGHRKRHGRFFKHRREEDFNHGNGGAENSSAVVHHSHHRERHNSDALVADDSFALKSVLAGRVGEYDDTMDHDEDNAAISDNWYESSKFIEFLEDDDDLDDENELVLTKPL
jgi:hypothetical protein